MIPVLVLRPEPGAGLTADRARALGLRSIVAPVAWVPPDPARFDALMLTSANAVRHAGPRLADYAALPAFAVGQATADAARMAELRVVHVGAADAAALLPAMAAAEVTRAIHLCGVDRRAVARPGIEVFAVPVYQSATLPTLPPALRDPIQRSAVALIHSPRAGEVLGALLDAAGLDRSAVAIAAISPAAAEAAGAGWRAIAIATTPDDRALLAEAARLCDGRG